MRKKLLLLASLLGVVVLVATGCVRYDSRVADCTASNGKVKIYVVIEKDSSNDKGDEVQTPAFVAACKAIESVRQVSLSG